MAILPTTPPDQPASRGTVTDGDGSERRYTMVTWNPFRPRPSSNTTTTTEETNEQATDGDTPDWGYRVAIGLAFAGIIAVTAITMYVSYEAQLIYTQMIKGEAAGEAGGASRAVQLAAASWDVAAGAFALLALATAIRGDDALRARVANLGCAVASILMNGARIDVPTDAGWLIWAGHILVWMGPAALYVFGSDMLVWEIQRMAMERRNRPLRQASIWSVIGLLAQVVLGVLLWLVRLFFSPWKTFTLFRQWFLAEMPYAPGRTLESDKAEAALAEATQARAVAAEIESRSATAIAEAQADYERRANEAEQQATDEIARIRAEETERADKAIRDERSRASKGIDEARSLTRTAVEECEAKVQGLEEKHSYELADVKEKHVQAVARLRADFDQQVATLTATVSDRDRDLERVRADLTRARTALATGERAVQDLQTTREQLTEERERRSRLEQRAQLLAGDRQELFALLSGRAQVHYLYRRLARTGDPRYGDEARFNEIAQEFVDQGVELTLAKIAYYLRSMDLSESGLADVRATDGSDDSMGGAL